MATATYVPLATQTLGSAANTITLSSIPSGYTDLRFVVSASSWVTSTASTVQVTFNGDAGSNYSMTDLYGDGTSASSYTQTSKTYILLEPSGTGNQTLPFLLTGDIFSYTGSTYKTGLFNSVNDTNGSGLLVSTVGLWRSTSAITSISLYTGASFNTGTKFTLWGI